MFSLEFLEDIVEGRHVPSFDGEGDGGGKQQVFESGLIEVFRDRPGEVRPFCPVEVIFEGAPGDTQALCRLPRGEPVTPTEP